MFRRIIQLSLTIVLTGFMYGWVGGSSTGGTSAQPVTSGVKWVTASDNKLLSNDLSKPISAIATTVTQPQQVRTLTPETPVTGDCTGTFNNQLGDRSVELCPTQYKLDVPEQATAIILELEKSGRLVMDFAIALGNPVGTGRFLRWSPDFDNPPLHLTRRFDRPDLQTGPWYIAVINYEPQPRNYTVTASLTPVPLKSGVPYNGTIYENTLGGRYSPDTRLLSSVDYTIEVPADATMLTIELRAITGGDIDLFVRYGKAVAVENGRAVTDYISESFGGNERIAITPSSNPPLRPGTYFIKIANNVNQRQNFTLTATIGATQPTQPPAIRVRPDKLDFRADLGSANPPPQQLEITNGGNGTLKWAASADQPWLVVNPTTGTAPSTITVSPRLEGLSVGTFKARLTIAAEAASNSPLDIDVTLTVTQPPATPVLQVRPATLTFSATLNGSSPSAQSFEITNTGGGSLTWTATADKPWIVLSPSSGTTPPTGTVSITVNLGSLSAGLQEGRITIAAPGVANSPQIVTVSLQVKEQSSTPTLRTLKFTQLFLMGEGWSRELRAGCVAYKSSAQGVGKIQIALTDGRIQEHSVPSNQEVVVCGDVTFLVSMGEPRMLENSDAGAKLSIFKFIGLELGEPARWELSRREGCMVLKNTRPNPNPIILTLSNGSLRELSVAAGREAFICGDVIHVE